MEIRVKYLTDSIEPLAQVPGSDWVDLRAAEDVTMRAGEFRLIPLGIAVALPAGYEAHVVPRSSTFKNYGLLQANSMGVVDGPPMPPGMYPSRKIPGSVSSGWWKISRP